MRRAPSFGGTKLLPGAEIVPGKILTVKASHAFSPVVNVVHVDVVEPTNSRDGDSN
jgi:hypothetical protein